jgi:hypothetical protein
MSMASLDGRLHLVVLLRDCLFLPLIYSFIQSKKVGECGLVRYFLNEYLVHFLHDIVRQIINGFLSTSCRSSERTFHNLRLLHELLSDLIQSDDFLLHV